MPQRAVVNIAQNRCNLTSIVLYLQQRKGGDTMKHYEKMLAMGCFSLHDVAQLTGNMESASTICRNYLKKGYIERLKRDLYVAISLETGQAVANRFVIASHISDNAVVSHHSAFEYYGYANQVFYEVQVTSGIRFRDFGYDGLQYRRIMPQIKGGIVQIGSVRVTTPERTVIDCIHLFEKVGGLEELLRCIALIPALKEAELLACLSEYDNGYLYQKTGCILSQYAVALGLSEAFFTECKKHLPKGKSYLYERTEDFTFYDEWQIYAPADFSRLTDKGVNDHDAI